MPDNVPARRTDSDLARCGRVAPEPARPTPDVTLHCGPLRIENLSATNVTINTINVDATVYDIDYREETTYRTDSYSYETCTVFRHNDAPAPTLAEVIGGFIALLLVGVFLVGTVVTFRWVRDAVATATAPAAQRRAERHQSFFDDLADADEDQDED